MGFSNWTELPEDIWDIVLHRLESPSDYVKFSVVCKLWNSVARNQIRRRTNLIGPPMLVTYTGKEETWNVCDMRNEKVLDLQLKLPNLRFCGSSLGWLIFMDAKFKVTLIDPFSRVIGSKGRRVSEISLPQLDHPGITERFMASCWDDYDFYIYKAIITADPVLNAKDCIIVVIYGDILKVAFIRLGDNKWTYINTINIGLIYDIVHIEDKLYGVNGGNQLVCFDFTSSQFKFTLVGEGFVVPQGLYPKQYLVESTDCKEILMVHRDTKYRRTGDNPRFTKGFKIFKFDADNRKWIEVSTLGDVSLFVGDSTMSMIASNITGCLPNCIYFIHDWDRRPYNRRGRHTDYGLYDMTNKNISHFRDASIAMKMSKRTPMWTIAKIKL